ncbi:MAG: hypothetical protein ABW168_01430 [Sedimenticola sp.]
MIDEQKEAIKNVSMNMLAAFNATLEYMLDAEEKIAFDKFYVAKYFVDAVDAGPSAGA